MGALIKKKAKLGPEGIVSKRRDLPYRSGLSIRQRNRPLLPPQSSKLAGMSPHGRAPRGRETPVEEDSTQIIVDWSGS